LGKFADELEGAEDFDAALQKLVCRTFTEHQRIIFNGNGYAQEWKDEAARRGLSNYPSTAKCLPTYLSEKNVDLVTKHGIYTEDEFRARHEIYLDAYRKIINIEAKTCIDMVLHQILPAAISYSKSLCEGMIAKQKVGISCAAESALASRLSENCDCLYSCCEALQKDLQEIPESKEAIANYCHDVITADIEKLRSYADVLERLTDKKYWPYPTYSDLLFY